MRQFTVYGTPFEMGVQTAKEFLPYLEKVRGKYEEKIKLHPVREQALAMKENVKAQYPEAYEEILGRAEGSAMSEDAAFLMFFPEIFRRTDGCTTLMLRRSDGKFLFSHNEDDKGYDHDNSALITYDYGDHTIVGFTMTEKLTGYAFGWNLGLHACFNEQWSAGLTYRAKEDMTFSGRTRFRHSGAPQGSAIMQNFLQTCNSRGKLTVPDTFTFGVMYKPLPNLSIEADLGYTVWSRYRSLGISMANNTPQFFEQKNWKDGWTFSIGAEYRPLDWLALRAGYTYETSPLQDDKCYDYLVPSNGRSYYTAGVGFAYGSWTLDLAYMYINVRDVNYPSFGGAGKVENGIIKEFAGKAHNSHCHNAAVTIGYRF